MNSTFYRIQIHRPNWIRVFNQNPQECTQSPLRRRVLTPTSVCLKTWLEGERGAERWINVRYVHAHDYPPPKLVAGWGGGGRVGGQTPAFKFFRTCNHAGERCTMKSTRGLHKCIFWGTQEANYSFASVRRYVLLEELLVFVFTCFCLLLTSVWPSWSMILLRKVLINKGISSSFKYQKSVFADPDP